RARPDRAGEDRRARRPVRRLARRDCLPGWVSRRDPRQRVVVVLASDVLIGFLTRDDAHHSDAVAQVRAALAPGTRRLLCAVNYAEILIGPMRVGAQDRVKQMLVQFNIETIQVDVALAEHAAS